MNLYLVQLVEIFTICFVLRKKCQRWVHFLFRFELFWPKTQKCSQCFEADFQRAQVMRKRAVVYTDKHTYTCRKNTKLEWKFPGILVHAAWVLPARAAQAIPTGYNASSGSPPKRVQLETAKHQLRLKKTLTKSSKEVKQSRHTVL